MDCICTPPVGGDKAEPKGEGSNVLSVLSPFLLAKIPVTLIHCPFVLAISYSDSCKRKLAINSYIHLNGQGFLIPTLDTPKLTKGLPSENQIKRNQHTIRAETCLLPAT